jgi:protein-disulfide isomerase-like protein with CxxC motif
LESSAQQATQRAEDAINRAGPQNMLGQSERSRIFRDELETAYRQVRNEESKLWDAVPPGDRSPTSEAESEFQTALAKATRVGEDKIPDAARRWLDPESPDYFDGDASIAEARRLMSVLREDARTARSAGQAFTAMMADDIADAIMRDLDSIPGVGGPLDTARAFSHEFNQVYRTGPIAEVLGTSRTGGDKVSAEETLRRLFGRTGESGVARAQAVEDAIGAEALPGGFRPEAQRQAADYLRRDFQDTIMDEAGNIRLRPAETFVARRRELLDTYPALGKLMDDAVGAARDAQTTRKTVESELAALSASPGQRLIDAPEHREFSSILTNSQSPAEDFFALRQIAEEAGPAAVDGLKSSAAAFLLGGAQTRRGGQAILSGDRMLNALSDPRTMDAMSAVLDPQELSRVQRIANELTVF